MYQPNVQLGNCLSLRHTTISPHRNATQPNPVQQEFCDLGCLQEALDKGWMRQDVTVVDSPPKMECVLFTGLEVRSY